MNVRIRLGFVICSALLSGPCLGERILDGQNLPPTHRVAAPAKVTKETRLIFKQNCVKCHGTEGRGKTVDGETTGAQDFTEQDWQQRVSVQRLLNSITHGRGQMPAFGKKLSEEQIKSLAALVLTFRD